MVNLVSLFETKFCILILKRKAARLVNKDIAQVAMGGGIA